MTYTNPGTASISAPNTPGLTSGKIRTLTLVWNPGVELRMFHDGIDDGATNAAGETILRDSNFGVGVPSPSNLSSYNCLNAIYLQYSIYNRVITASEARELHKYPYGTTTVPRYITLANEIPLYALFSAGFSFNPVWGNATQTIQPGVTG